MKPFNHPTIQPFNHSTIQPFPPGSPKPPGNQALNSNLTIVLLNSIGTSVIMTLKWSFSIYKKLKGG
ncbi:hypothetical protein A3D03_05115 [Candidatus Gottesmanbacteria bacterium RIFCSPHIGHO2_02_FULL_40_13]|uniref:Uncharacterized protein n=1 Tax=Candidatus Gottesmanbacteria bacterium RIFCSPHIGHO2_02_FULL_40_13 TaxID=1798384 RepID=A0A1F6ABK0_9BACT|nr:MAG: hypothetical protein A3D03_05115 [Candidatus Gottesmanbacteria bacterium RIFCSPHIGHO2_02_FULL_40_13]